MQDFEYLQPKSIKEANELLGNNWEDSLLYAGGTDLLSLVKDEIQTPAKLVNLKSIPGLNTLEYTPGKGLHIGALVNVTDIAENPMVNEKYPVLAQSAQSAASPQLRNMGTMGGNLCQRPRCWYFRGDFHCLRKGGDICFAVDGENKYHCIIGGSPCFIVHPSDPAVALVALDASVTVFDGKKERQIPLRKFFILPEENVRRENILEPGEIVTGIQVPDLPTNTKSAYIKFKERDTWDFAVVSVAAVLRIQGNQVQSGSIALGGVAPKPWLEKEIGKKLNGFRISKENIKKLSSQALADAEPLEFNQYKLPLARNLVRRVLTDLSGA
jgi:xanthine dehydrogenase YagS FAD-binding subunit